MNDEPITAPTDQGRTGEEDSDSTGVETASLPGIIRELGDLGPGAVITEGGLARLFRRHPVSIKRAVQRGELPPPCRLCGSSAWTAGVIVRHLESRLEKAAKDMARLEQKIARLSP